MKIEVIRHYFSEAYTIGKLYFDGVYFCDTLEPSTTAPQHPAVKLGSYPLSIVMSHKVTMEKVQGRQIPAGNNPHG